MTDRRYNLEDTILVQFNDGWHEGEIINTQKGAYDIEYTVNFKKYGAKLKIQTWEIVMINLEELASI